MASGEDPVQMSADGLPTGLVVLATESDPVVLQHHVVEEATVVEAAVSSLHKTGEDENDVEFCQDVEEGISMVSTLSHFGSHLDISLERNVDESEIIQW